MSERIFWWNVIYRGRLATKTVALELFNKCQFLGNYVTPIDRPTDGHKGSEGCYTSNNEQARTLAGSAFPLQTASSAISIMYWSSLELLQDRIDAVTTSLEQLEVGVAESSVLLSLSRSHFYLLIKMLSFCMLGIPFHSLQPFIAI